MPHIVVEYSENLATEIKQTQLLKQLHAKVSDFGLFSPEFVKARGIVFTDYVLPEAVQAFVHITCSILDGRPPEKRLELSQQLFELAAQLMPADAKVSVNIHEMDKATYHKK